MADDLTVSLRQGMASVAQAAQQAGRSVDQLARKTSAYAQQAESQLKRVGQAMQRIGAGLGGPLGGVLGRGGAALGLGGGVGAAAAGGAAVGAIGALLSRTTEVFAQRAQAAAEQLAKLRDAARSAEQAQRSFAASAADEGELLARAQWVAGAGARQQAEAIAREVGVDLRTALQALIAAQGDRVDAAAAALAARTGQVSIDEAAQRIRAHFASGEALGDWSTVGRASVALAGADPAERERVAQRLRELERLPAQRRLRGIAEARDLEARAALDAFERGATEVALRREAAARANPQAEAQLQLFAAYQEQAQQLRDLAAATPTLVALFQRLTSAAGDAELALRRLHRAAAVGAVER